MIPTPDSTLRKAVGSIEWPAAFALFVAPCLLMGIAEGAPLLGLSLGLLMPAQFVLMAWWWGPI